MKKVLFLVKYPIDEPYSIKIKLDGQMVALRELGYDVYYLAFDHDYFYLLHNNDKIIIKKIMFRNMKSYIHTKAFYDLFDSVIKVLKQISFDCVYMRSCPLSAIGYRAIKRISNSGSKLIVEIPTYPSTEEKPSSFLRRIYSFYSSYWKNKSTRYCDLYTLIGSNANSYCGKPAINISNGILVDSVKQKTNDNLKQKEIHLLALASMSFWHGYDRLIEGINNASDEIKNNVVLDMVGGEGDRSLSEWKKLVLKYGLGKQVVFHGRKTGVELDDVFNKSDVGICSLGMFRTGFKSGFILKLREYTARGLPFVYAADDPEISDDLPFCIQIPNDGTPVDMEKVMNFAIKMRKEQNIGTIMREYARKNMSWTTQFEKVFEAIKTLSV